MTREDILREATALVERIELEVSGYDEPLTIGFRRNGSASFFVGTNLVIQFNSEDELRRLYYEGQLIKAERGSLISMQRVRTEQATELRARSLQPDATRSLVQLAEQHLGALTLALSAGLYRVTGQFPADGDIVSRIRDWLIRRPSPVRIADKPNAQ